MTIFCLQCAKPIPGSRATRGAVCCSPECHKLYRKQKRDYRASKACRLCGRGIRHSKTKESQETSVRSEHTTVQDVRAN